MCGRKYNNEDVSPVPSTCDSFNVQETLHVHFNENGNGAHIPGVLTLVPRKDSWTRFLEGMLSPYFYPALNKIIDHHASVSPRGKSRLPLFEGNSKGTYATFGTSCKRFGKGLMLNIKFLTGDDWSKESYLLSCFWSKVECIAEAYIDSESLHAMKVVKEVAEYPGFQFTHKKKENQNYGHQLLFPKTY